jgi:hypothetical protein
MSYFRLEHKLKEVKQYAEDGLTNLLETGVASVSEIIKLKKGYPVFIGGAPFAGKTEFAFELMVNQAILYNHKSFIYCGEGGDIEHIFYELLFKYLRKPYKWCDEKEKIQAEYFISEHFVICDHDSDYTIESFYGLIAEAEKEYEIKFDLTCFDPFNDIEDDPFLQVAEHKFLASALKRVRVSSKKNKRIDILVTHIADIKAEKDTETKKWYMRAAMPNEWSGGRAWWRRAFIMILVYRPEIFLKDENGRNYEENETIIYVQKAKPKGVGKIGHRSIFWDWKKNIYYSCDSQNNILSSCEKPFTNTIAPNLDFSIPTHEQANQPPPF